LVYVDSNVFIYPIIYDERSVEEAKRSRALLLKIASGSAEASTATITWDELVWVVWRVLGEAEARKRGRLFLEFPNLRLLAVKRSTILNAQRLMDEYGLKPRDAIHAAAALENRIDTIVSYDKDFDEVRELKRVEP